MSTLFLSFVVCAAVVLIISPIVFRVLRRLKTGQNILEYVDNHRFKQGTLSMGGILFLFGGLASCFFFETNKILAILSLVVSFAYGLVGFLDDYLKIRNKHNEGLKPYQKIIGQVGIAVIISIFVYNFGLTGGAMHIPFTDIEVNVSWWIVPICIFFYIAVTNSVNLTDGLDGLAGYTSFIVIISLGLITYLRYLHLVDIGSLASVYLEYRNIAVACFGVGGAVLAFLLFNCYPAAIFMGDTGSLALGGFIASVCAFTGEYILLIVLGIVYVISATSVIIQVAVYKLTHKRVFKMAPIHHHLERCGLFETKIVGIYVFVTIIVALLSIAFYVPV